MSFNTPIFEAPDAYFHFAVIEYTARTGETPPTENAHEQPWQHAVFHAPLYYQMGAILIGGIDTTDFLTKYRLNPHAQVGEPQAENNVNFVTHGVVNTLQGTKLAVWIVRFLSMTLGMITLMGVYGITRILWSENRSIALIAIALVIFNPQFLFMHGVVSNDTLVTALSTLILLLLFHQMRSGISTYGVFLLALLLALNSISKASGLTLYPIVGLGMLWAVWQQRIHWQRVLLYAALGVGMWFLIAGWWYWNNFINFGDPTATQIVAETAGLRSAPPQNLMSELGGMYYSFWALFGWFNIMPPVSFYTLPSLLIGLSGIGVGIALFRNKLRINKEDWFIIGLMTLYLGIFTLSWLQYNQMVNAAQGRILFPLLGIFAPILAFGLTKLPRFIRIVPITGLAFATFILPAMIIHPMYTVEEAEFHTEEAVEITIREPWKEDTCLTAWTTPAQWSADAIEVDVWWQATCQMEGFWSVFIHFVDLEMETCTPGITDYIFAQYDTMPQGGNLPFPAMQLGTLYHDKFSLPTPSDIDRTQQWHLYLGLYDAGGQTGTRAPVSSEEFTGVIQTGKCAGDVIRYQLPLLDGG